jgi:hypothetical protein
MRALCLFVLANAAGFSHGTLDLLLALGPQIFAEAAPVENREPAPEVTFDPVLSLLNVAFAHHARVHGASPFAPACRRPGRVCFVSPRAIF